MQVRIDALQLGSRRIPIARIRRQVGPRWASYPWREGHDLRLYNDGSADALGSAGAFADLTAAIREAQHFCFLADWSFQPLFRPTQRHARGEAALSDTIGQLLCDRAERILVAIHAWDHTNVGAADPQNDDGDAVLDALATGQRRPLKLLWRASSHDTSTYSHHQKFVVLDVPATQGPGAGGRRELAVFSAAST